MSKKWTRVDKMPAVQKVTFVVSVHDDPELAQWVWDLPYRGASAKVREVLSAHARGLAAATSSASPGPASSAALKIAQPKAAPAHARPTHAPREGAPLIEATRTAEAPIVISTASDLDTDALNAMRQLGSMG